MRLTNEELQKVKEKYDVKELWSWSKIEKAMTSPYEYFLKYVIHKPEDRTDCAYGTMGGLCHDTLEKFYKKDIEYEEMKSLFNDGWITAIDIVDMKFDRNDEEKNKKIGTKYKANLEQFFRNHIPIENKVVLEQFVTAKIGDCVLQGYIDTVFKEEVDNEDNYVILDWKTSTEYKGKEIEKKCGQLVVYAIALNQMGIPFERIKIGWNFLKYCTVFCNQKNKKVKERHIERSLIGEKLQSSVTTWLKHFGYENEIEHYLNLMLEKNSIDVLPDKVKEQYKVTDCYVYIPLTKDLIDRWTEKILFVINDMKLREKEYEETKDDIVFWDSKENIKEEEYYFATLCGYSPKLHLPYKKYLEDQEAKENGADMFIGVGEDKAEFEECINDLSWLNSL